MGIDLNSTPVVVLVRVPVASLASNLVQHPKDAYAGRQGPQRGAGLASSDTSGDLSGLVVQALVRTPWLVVPEMRRTICRSQGKSTRLVERSVDFDGCCCAGNSRRRRSVGQDGG